MGYNAKTAFPDLMLDLQYAAVARYPRHWRTVFLSHNPEGSSKSAPPGVVQAFGAFYCEAAAPLLTTGNLIGTMHDLRAEQGLKSHDERLAAIFPYLAGTNSRPKRARANPGRPRSGGRDADLLVKLDVVCPAVQGRCRCPLKPQSMNLAALDAPTANPVWAAHERTICQKSSITVTLNPDQLRMAQFDPELVPGSWEHAIYFEACRSHTERQFSFLKNPHVTGISDLVWAPRRPPMIKIILALTVAAANLRSQQGHTDRPEKPESIRTNLQQLARDLGHPPTRTPPRT
jgi:hypothetical protein